MELNGIAVDVQRQEPIEEALDQAEEAMADATMES